MIADLKSHPGRFSVLTENAVVALSVGNRIQGFVQADFGYRRPVSDTAVSDVDADSKWGQSHELSIEYDPPTQFNRSSMALKALPGKSLPGCLDRHTQMHTE